jgi:enamine deaminase RidA (YjgF/YER057c/UK114 family)
MIQRVDSNGIFNKIVIYRNVAYLAGIIADSGLSGIYNQSRNIFDKAECLLDAAGTSKNNILSALIFVSDLALKDDMNRAWKEWLPTETLPTRATIGRADLGQNVLIEVVLTVAVY